MGAPWLSRMPLPWYRCLAVESTSTRPDRRRFGVRFWDRFHGPKGLGDQRGDGWGAFGSPNPGRRCAVPQHLKGLTGSRKCLKPHHQWVLLKPMPSTNCPHRPLSSRQLGRNTRVRRDLGLLQQKSDPLRVSQKEEGS